MSKKRKRTQEQDHREFKSGFSLSEKVFAFYDSSLQEAKVLSVNQDDDNPAAYVYEVQLLKSKGKKTVVLQGKYLCRHTAFEAEKQTFLSHLMLNERKAGPLPLNFSPIKKTTQPNPLFLLDPTTSADYWGDIFFSSQGSDCSVSSSQPSTLPSSSQDKLNLSSQEDGRGGGRIRGMCEAKEDERRRILTPKVLPSGMQKTVDLALSHIPHSTTSTPHPAADCRLTRLHDLPLAHVKEALLQAALEDRKDEFVFLIRKHSAPRSRERLQHILLDLFVKLSNELANWELGCDNDISDRESSKQLKRKSCELLDYLRRVGSEISTHPHPSKNMESVALRLIKVMDTRPLQLALFVCDFSLSTLTNLARETIRLGRAKHLQLFCVYYPAAIREDFLSIAVCHSHASCVELLLSVRTGFDYLDNIAFLNALTNANPLILGHLLHYAGEEWVLPSSTFSRLVTLLMESSLSSSSFSSPSRRRPRSCASPTPNPPPTAHTLDSKQYFKCIDQLISHVKRNVNAEAVHTHTTSLQKALHTLEQSGVFNPAERSLKSKLAKAISTLQNIIQL